MSFFRKLLHRKKEGLKEVLKEIHPFEDNEEEFKPEDEKEEESEASFGEEPEEDPDAEYEIVEREILPEKIICPDCGGITLEGLDFCDKCGGELH